MSDLQTDNNQQPPSHFPERAPGTHYATDHSFTLQAIMEMQKAIGGISAEIKALSAGQQNLKPNWIKWKIHYPLCQNNFMPQVSLC